MPLRIISSASVTRIRREYITGRCRDDVRDGTAIFGNTRRRTVCGHHSSTTRQALFAMDKDHAAFLQSLLDEATCRGQVYEQVRVVNVLNWYA